MSNPEPAQCDMFGRAAGEQDADKDDADRKERLWKIARHEDEQEKPE